jgi:hypothetical protein
MSKLDIDRELGELIFRFKNLKKAIEEEKSLSPAQRAAAAEAAKFASELSKSKTPAPTDKARAQNLAALLQKRGVPGIDYTQRVQLQPTDEQLFGHLVVDPKKAEELEKNWGNTMNNWLAEATKPISSRFKSKEEEEAYWNNIKVSDNSRGDSGF